MIAIARRPTVRAAARAHFLRVCAVTIASSVCAFAGQTSAGRPATPQRSALYAAAGTELTHYEVQLDPAALVKKATVTLPGSVQYAWPHPSNGYLYVVWSEGPRDHPNGLSAFRIDAAGSLQPHGSTAFLKARSISVTVDRAGNHVLVAYNTPSSVSVHRISPDGTIGAEVMQPPGLDTGNYAHQVVVHPSDRAVIVVTRGNVATKQRPENPGALKIFGYKDGVLSNRGSIAPGGGFGFQPRDVDFHPSGKWVFASLEAQSQLHVYRETPDGMLSDAPIFTKPALFAPVVARPELNQRSGTVHVHPNGKFVYQAARATDTTDGRGTGAWGAGTNGIGVFEIDQTTGEPTLIQMADSHGMVPRTFSLDPSATILVAGNQDRLDRPSPAISLPASLALFRVLPNGKLDYLRRYDVVTTGTTTLFWMGIVPLPQ